jgi:hypothetical protein
MSPDILAISWTRTNIVDSWQQIYFLCMHFVLTRTYQVREIDSKSTGVKVSSSLASGFRADEIQSLAVRLLNKTSE